MLHAMPDVAGVTGDEIGALVNTHANGDLTCGNRLVRNASIIATEASAHEMAVEDAPEHIAAIMNRLIWGASWASIWTTSSDHSTSTR